MAQRDEVRAEGEVTPFAVEAPRKEEYATLTDLSLDEQRGPLIECDQDLLLTVQTWLYKHIIAHLCLPERAPLWRWKGREDRMLCFKEPRLSALTLL